MNERQRRFAELYAADPNATEAAKAAGYSEKTAYSQGQRMLKNVEIVSYIQKLQEQLASERIASVDEVKTVWTELLRSPGEKSSDRIKAGELLAKSAGIFTPLRPCGALQNTGAESYEPEPLSEQEEVAPLICVPYNGRGDEPNAAEMPDGTIRPLAGAEDTDVLIYVQARKTE